MKNVLSRVVGGLASQRSAISAGDLARLALTTPAASRNAAVESLESRQMMALLGVTLGVLPIEFYNATGQLRYDASNGSFDVVATPTSIFLPTGPRAIVASDGDFQIHARLNSSGGLVRGAVAGDSAVIGSVNANGDDFVMRGGIDLNNNGSIDPITETGTLLTGELYAFGFLDSGGPTDQYDYKFVVTGGLLAPFYAGRDGGITMTSEASTFIGDFAVSHQGQAKGSVGPVARPAVSSISGYTYYDADNDGNFAGSDLPIPGTTVNLTGVNDAGQSVSLSTTTDSNGFYIFGGLRPGQYQINEIQPAGYLDGKDTIGTPGGSTSNDQFAAINLPAGFNGVQNNFGEILASSISGYTYYDSNNDGNFAGSDTAIAGVTVTLTGTDDLGNSVNESATTDGNGFYIFSNLRPGQYQLNETQPAGYLDGKDTIGTPGGTTSNDQFSGITLPMNFNGVQNNFGEILASSISGYTYYDSNNDGNFAGSDTAIAGVTVDLTGTDDLGNSVSLSTITDSNGFYIFSGLRPGTYQLNETQPVAYLDGIDTIGTPGGTSNDDEFADIVLPVNFNGVQNNFGEILASSISGYTYYDANNDGLFAGADAPIANVTVTLTGTDDLGNSVNQMAMTDSTGYYIFVGLRPGEYRLNETQPAGYLDGKDTIGTPGGVTSNDQFSSIALPVNFNGVQNNFGEILPSSIGGWVYCDSNGNCIRDNGENGIGGVTITLTGTDDLGQTVLQTWVTLADGSYNFTGLRPGVYTLTETQPMGIVDGGDTAGSLGGTAGNDIITGINVGVNQSGVDYLFGEVCTTGSISGTKYRDITGNGLTSDDTGLGGVVVYIDRNNNGSLDSNEERRTTAANGTYSFTGLPAGNYIIREVIDTENWVRTAPVLTDKYTLSLGSSQSISGIDFANAEKNCQCALASYSFTATRADGTTSTFGNLRGNTNQGEEIVVTFTVRAGYENQRFTLVSYTAPGASFDANTASQQRIYEVDTGLFGPGTHTLRVHNPDSNYQIDFVCGWAIDQFGPAGSNIFFTPQGRLISADNDGRNAVVPNAGSISGNVYVDLNDNGQFNSNESGIARVAVTLTFTDAGQQRTITKLTDSRGFYFFSNLKPNLSYTLSEAQPAAYFDGRDTVGSLGGNGSTNDRFSSITVGNNQSGINYNFGERLVSGTQLTAGDTATIGYWNNKNGQALIKKMNGSSTATHLGNWLATNFSSLFGSHAGSANMTGKTNSQVASFYKTRFAANNGPKLEAQIMAAAIASYVTSSALAGGNYAASYGFTVSSAGSGARIMSVGSNGATFGVANNSSLTVMQYLRIANINASNNGTAWNGNSSARSAANTVFTAINETGDIR